MVRRTALILALILAGVAPARTQCTDCDVDGFVSPADCNDADASIFPGAQEICNGLDDDCDGFLDDEPSCSGMCDTPGFAQVNPTELVGLGGFTPELIWTGAEFGVALQHVTPIGNGVLTFDRIDPAGTIASSTELVNSSLEPGPPTLAWSGTQYSVAWPADLSDLFFEPVLQRVDPAGSPAGPLLLLGDPPDPSSNGGPQVIWTGAEFGVFWVHGQEIRLTRISPSGTVVGNDLVFGPLPSTVTSISAVWTGSEYALSWSDMRDSDFEIFFARVSDVGVPLGNEIQLTTDTAFTENQQLVWNGSGFGLLWLDRSTARVLFTKLDSTGGRLQADTVLLSGQLNGRIVRMAWTGEEYGVAYTDPRNAFLLRVDASGNGILPPFPLTQFTAPDDAAVPNLVWNGSEYGVAWSQNVGSSRTVFTRVGCNCFDTDSDGFHSCLDCDDGSPLTFPGAAEVCDRQDNNCDGIVDEGFADTDLDGYPDACDNCPAAFNPAQVDTGGGPEGDACDLNDGFILVQIESPSTARWQEENGFSTYNFYRGDLEVLRSALVYSQAEGSNPLARRECNQSRGSLADNPDLNLGQAAFYLVTGNSQGSESSLGLNSAGLERPHENSCH